jgi:hypothetical protein
MIAGKSERRLTVAKTGAYAVSRSNGHRLVCHHDVLNEKNAFDSYFAMLLYVVASDTRAHARSVGRLPARGGGAAGKSIRTVLD